LSSLKNVFVIGAGMYVSGGSETSAHGTILPSLMQMQSMNEINDIIVIATKTNSSKSVLNKVKIIESMLGYKSSVRAFPEVSNSKEEYKKQLLKARTGDIVIVSVPDHLHFEVTNYCLDLNLHCMVVKPLAPTGAEAYQLAVKADEKELIGVVEFHKRFDEANMLFKDNLSDGRVGDPVYFLIEYSQKKIIPEEKFSSWVNHTNIFQYLGVHYVDLIYHMTGATPKRVMAIGQKRYLSSKGIENYDAIQATVEWQDSKGELFVSMHITNWIDSNKDSAMSNQKIKVIGSGGRIESEQKDRGLTIIDEMGEEKVNPYFSKWIKQSNDTYLISGYGPRSIFEFIDIVNGKKELKNSRVCTFREAIVSSNVIEASTESLKLNGAWINI
jgi:predicted dehydrogenase